MPHRQWVILFAKETAGPSPLFREDWSKTLDSNISQNNNGKNGGWNFPGEKGLGF
jgi:hypothetical protein